MDRRRDDNAFGDVLIPAAQKIAATPFVPWAAPI
jgi:hypothetical protein